MNTIFGIIIIILVVAYLGASKSIHYKRVPYSIKLFSASGLTYLILGIGLGITGIDLINKEVLANISPLIQLLLSWVGLIFGAQFKISLVKRVPVRMYLGSFFQSIVTFFTIFLSCSLAIMYLRDVRGLSIDSDSAIVIAAIGCVSSPTLLAIILRQLKVEGKIPKFLRLTSSIDGLIGILIMSVFFAFFHQDTVFISKSYFWFLYQIFISVFLGLFFILMARLPNNSNEKFVLLLGMLTFSGGVAYITHFSPLFMNMIIGFILGNEPKTSAWIDRQLDIGERPFYLIMLLLLGAHYSFTLDSLSILLLPAAYIAAHAFGKQVGVPLGAYIAGLKVNTNAYLGGGLYYQGGIAVAMALTYLILAGQNDVAADWVISSIILGLIINGLISPKLITKALSKTEVIES